MTIVMSVTCGLYHKHVMLVNDDSRVVRMMLQVVLTPTIIILMTLEVPMIVILMTLEAPVIVILMNLENIYSTAITYNRHL